MAKAKKPAEREAIVITAAKDGVALTDSDTFWANRPGVRRRRDTLREGIFQTQTGEIPAPDIPRHRLSERDTAVDEGRTSTVRGEIKRKKGSPSGLGAREIRVESNEEGSLIF